MKDYFKKDEWCIIEEGFHREFNKISESIFSLGNGRMGQRGNFEEQFTGETLLGNYVAGVYYPDKTRVGWWKNGYPEYFAKVLNAPNWLGIEIAFDGEFLDLAKCTVENFTRTLNMKEGYLDRSFTAKMTSGKTVKISARRFCSIVEDECAAIRYDLTPLDFDAELSINIFIDADVKNEDANYDEKFWTGIDTAVGNEEAMVLVETKKTAFQVCTGMRFDVAQDGRPADFKIQKNKRDKYVGCILEMKCQEGKETMIHKYVANLSSENHPKEELMDRCSSLLKSIHLKGFAILLQEQAAAWAKKWEECDVIIEGDIAAQQGIRFNIFQLYQTYTGKDERLNIGPKGFTGEKYGGSTYWDTEAYCLPFYLSTASQEVARNLLVYRHNQLGKAIENAAKLGFKDGAALYPMVTMNGEECHNEWEITFEEIHRNGAIAYAIFDYIRYTGDEKYLEEFGLEVLIGIARFWAQRVHFSEHKQQFVMHGVTGPNEYENNVNNNWYTSIIAIWCLQYTLDSIATVREKSTTAVEALFEQIKFYEFTETKLWKQIIGNMYLPEDEKLGIFLQQDGFLDKEQIMAADLKEEDRPLCQKWSWDRILRSCFIKQADVLQGIYFFEENYDRDTLQRNFDYYEPRTVHESSLSPCVHSILAARLGMKDKAYEMYLRTARLDLDDYNNDTEDGCHITSMAGTWMSVVKGFGGMRVKDGVLHFSPFIPKEWTAYSFKINFRNQVVEVKVKATETEIVNLANEEITLYVNDHKKVIAPKGVLVT